MIAGTRMVEIKTENGIITCVEIAEELGIKDLKGVRREVIGTMKLRVLIRDIEKGKLHTLE